MSVQFTQIITLPLYLARFTSRSCFTLFDSFALDAIISTLNFFFFIRASSCFFTDTLFVAPLALSTVTCSFALKMLSNRPAAIDVDNRALFTDRLCATKAKARDERMQIKDSAVSILMTASDSL